MILDKIQDGGLICALWLLSTFLVHVYYYMQVNTKEDWCSLTQTLKSDVNFVIYTVSCV